MAPQKCAVGLQKTHSRIDDPLAPSRTVPAVKCWHLVLCRDTDADILFFFFPFFIDAASVHCRGPAAMARSKRISGPTGAWLRCPHKALSTRRARCRAAGAWSHMLCIMHLLCSGPRQSCLSAHAWKQLALRTSALSSGSAVPRLSNTTCSQAVLRGAVRERRWRNRSSPAGSKIMLGTPQPCMCNCK